MYNVLLVGNPNSGKTTIFNALTGSSERVGNWHGVTVNAAIGRFKWEGKEISVTDLPGLYSINGGSMEETVSIRHIFEGNHLIVNVIEGVNLKRSLILTKELISAGKGWRYL